MANNYLQKFAKPTGWTNLHWTSNDTKDSLAGLFPDGCTLLLGFEDDDFCTLTWLDEKLRWHAVRGFIPQSLSAPGSLGVQTKLKVDGKESEVAYVLTLTVSEAGGKLSTLKGAIDRVESQRGPGSGTIGVFTAEANPMGEENRGFLRWLQRLFHLPVKPREPRRLAP